MFLHLLICLIFGWNVSAQNRVLIDPGHGGKDWGAIGKNQAKEKNVILEIAKTILELNKKSNSPFDIYLTRYTDTLISLSDRAKLAKALNVDFFISLHCNHSENPDARGVEVYMVNPESNFFDKATWLAYRLQDNFNQKLGFESRGVKFANFQVLRETIEYCPSVLLELGFLSNGDEAKYIKDKQKLFAIAVLIFYTLQKEISYERTISKNMQ